MNELKLKDGDIVSFIVPHDGINFTMFPLKTRYLNKYNYILNPFPSAYPQKNYKDVFIFPVYVLHGKKEGLYFWEAKGSFLTINLEILKQNKNYKKIKFVVCRKGKNYDDTFYRINVFPFESDLGLEMIKKAEELMKEVSKFYINSIEYLDDAIIGGKIPEKNILTYKTLELGE